MKKKTSKYKILRGFDNKMKAEKFMESLKIKEGISLYTRTWNEGDKKRYYVRQLVRKGTK